MVSMCITLYSTFIFLIGYLVQIPVPILGLLEDLEEKALTILATAVL